MNYEVWLGFLMPFIEHPKNVLIPRSGSGSGSGFVMQEIHFAHFSLVMYFDDVPEKGKMEFFEIWSDGDKNPWCAITPPGHDAGIMSIGVVAMLLNPFPRNLSDIMAHNDDKKINLTEELMHLRSWTNFHNMLKVYNIRTKMMVVIELSSSYEGVYRVLVLEMKKYGFCKYMLNIPEQINVTHIGSMRNVKPYLKDFSKPGAKIMGYVEKKIDRFNPKRDFIIRF